MKRFVVSAGSNIYPEENMRAVEEILRSETRLIAASTMRRTAPVPPAGGGPYLNRAFLIETPLGEAELKGYLRGVETRLGRVRGPDRHAPRTMDLDIVAVDGRVVDEDYYRYPFVREAVDELLGASGRAR